MDSLARHRPVLVKQKSKATRGHTRADSEWLRCLPRCKNHLPDPTPFSIRPWASAVSRTRTGYRSWTFTPPIRTPNHRSRKIFPTAGAPTMIVPDFENGHREHRHNMPFHIRVPLRRNARLRSSTSRGVPKRADFPTAIEHYIPRSARIREIDLLVIRRNVSTGSSKNLGSAPLGDGIDVAPERFGALAPNMPTPPPGTVDEHAAVCVAPPGSRKVARAVRSGQRNPRASRRPFRREIQGRRSTAHPRRNSAHATVS